MTPFRNSVLFPQSRNEYIAHLKDQLQEMKAKTNLENHYMKRNTELQVAQTQRKCNRTEELLLEEIEVAPAVGWRFRTNPKGEKASPGRAGLIAHTLSQQRGGGCQPPTLGAENER